MISYFYKSQFSFDNQKRLDIREFLKPNVAFVAKADISLQIPFQFPNTLFQITIHWNFYLHVYKVSRITWFTGSSGFQDHLVSMFFTLMCLPCHIWCSCVKVRLQGVLSIPRGSSLLFKACQSRQRCNEFRGDFWLLLLALDA